jgi:hypothetical protein
LKGFAADARGSQLVEDLAIIGIVVIILGVTFLLLKTPVTTWWNASVMPLF